jgi:hypothetical protein
MPDWSSSSAEREQSVLASSWRECWGKGWGGSDRRLAVEQRRVWCLKRRTCRASEGSNVLGDRKGVAAEDEEGREGSLEKSGPDDLPPRDG